MKTEDLKQLGLHLLTPKRIGDTRGFFIERYNQKAFEQEVGISPTFVQDNHSRSMRGVLRGLHYQLPPHAQGKLVSVLAGEILGVAVDVRRSSPTFGHWAGVHLSSDNLHQLWIPEGFAHGFLVLSESADVLYKTTSYYTPEADRSLAWDDPALAIEWPLDRAPNVSPRDAAALLLAEADLFD